MKILEVTENRLKREDKIINTKEAKSQKLFGICKLQHESTMSSMTMSIAI